MILFYPSFIISKNLEVIKGKNAVLQNMNPYLRERCNDSFPRILDCVRYIHCNDHNIYKQEHSDVHKKNLSIGG